MQRGCGINGDGHPEAGMGVACGDYDGNGTLDLICTHFYMEHDTLFHNLGPQGFVDWTAEAGLSAATRASMGWGTAFIDYDKDGWLDWLVVNGHMNKEGAVPYEMESKLFRNTQRTPRFEDVSPASGEFFQRKYVGRGLAVADLDRDGSEDLVVTILHEPAVVLENHTETANHALRITLAGRSSNRDGINARVTATAGERRIVREVIGGGSYLSASSYELIIGVGEAEQAEVEVEWPSGIVERWKALPLDRPVRLREATPGWR